MKKLSSRNIGTVIRTKFAPSYTIPFTADLERKKLETFENKTNNLVEVHRWHIFDLGAW